MTRFMIAWLLMASCVLASAAGVEPEAKRITLALTVEPPSLDTSHTEDTTSGFILRFIGEGLVNIDRRGRPVPAVAVRWRVTDQDATFWLRPDARWSDGKPVTAHDFVYAWRRLVNPATGGAGSTFFAYVIKNAEDILAGKKPVDSLGVNAIDDHTLHVTLSRPVPYLLNVLSGTAYWPLRQDFVEAQKGRYAADAANMISNGPFKLVSWTHNASLVMKKNDLYWDSKDIKLNEVDVGYITSDTRSLFNLYKSGDIAALALDQNILDDAQRAGERIRKAPTNCVAWLDLNVRPGHPTSNLKVREALRAAFDRGNYVNNIVSLPGSREVNSVFTRYIKGDNGQPFETEYPAPEIRFDIPKAKQLLNEALVEMGLDKLPPIILLANETRQIEAEYIQQQLMSALGIEVRVDKQTFKQAIAKMNSGDFDVARQGFCSGSLQDPVFFAGIFDSKSAFNNGGWANAEYDRLMQVTHSTSDQKVRMQAFDRMQHLLYDEVPVIPIYENSNVYVQDRRVGGLVRFPTQDFSRGYIR